MQQFPPLGTWFELQPIDSVRHRYTRLDLCLRDDLDDATKGALIDEIALLIARLRLRPNQYQEWLRYWENPADIPQQWKSQFQHSFWKSFVSQAATDRAQGEITFDDVALQGYLGELMLYIVQYQMYGDRILEVEPLKPKPYSKNDGIDCLEIIGMQSDDGTDFAPDFYIVWEAKGLTSPNLGDYPTKIYNQHIAATPKSFGEIVDLLAHRHENDNLSGFIDRMVESFYMRPAGSDKAFGACVTYSNQRFPRPDAFSAFHPRFISDLADDLKCRQVRICAIGDLQEIAEGVRDRIWSKLRH